jgi:kynurenine formamidase
MQFSPDFSGRRQGGQRMAESDIQSVIGSVSNWGRWGADDELGTVNFISPAKRVEAASLIRTGKVFSLAIPLDENGPLAEPRPEGRGNPRHMMLATGTDLAAGRQLGAEQGRGYADDMVEMALQCATQWDALSHQFWGYKMYNDRDCTLVGTRGAEKNAIDKLAAHIVTRGVLIDVPRHLGQDWLEQNHEISVRELEGVLAAQKVGIGTGDVLLIRTGNMKRVRQSGSWAGYTHSDEPGLGLAALPWLHEKQVAGVAADTWAFEVIPSRASIPMPIHAVGIVHMGLLIGEIFDLEALGEDCAGDGVYEFFFSAPPLPFSKAVGSPINPLAIK